MNRNPPPLTAHQDKFAPLSGSSTAVMSSHPGPLTSDKVVHFCKLLVLDLENEGAFSYPKDC